MASFSTRRPLGFALLLAMLAGPALRGADLIALPALGLRVERGFRVTLFADSDLANDIYAMTLDPRGNVVVTSQGYIRTLYDRDNDGVADAATDFAITRTGCMGLCFDGTDLWFVGDGGLFRFSDRNADGVADGPPEQLLPLAGGEHGAHAIRKGPDGSWYLIGGNDTGFGSRHATWPNSPVSTSEAGALLRLTPDGRSSEIIAQGFRNPYDFDFNFAGDLFTYDSDVEADFFLPWYTPTRVYHVGHAGHHGWRLKGHQRSWNRPGYYADTVDVLAPIGRGSPTGVACYRHYQFPPYYHGGLFALDWTFGKVYFLPLEIAGAAYRAPPEVFLESIGTHGFAPTDAVVAPDGSLLVSIGGRKTRGAVYRIQYIADIGRVVTATNWLELSTTGVEAALAAPQPLEAWSRAVWVPLAQRLGPELFETAAAEETLLPETRTRAIEIVTEVHGGLSTGAAQRLARASLPLVRARVAWSLGRVPCSNYQPILLGLARDSAPLARRFALEAIGDRSGDFDPAALRQALGANLAHPEKRIRQAAARLALTLPEPDWNALWEQTAKADAQSRLTVILARLWRTSREEIDVAAVDAALAALGQSRLADHRLQAIRLIILALGDWRLQQPPTEVHTAYDTALPLDGHEALVGKIRKAAAPLLSSGDATVNLEAARLLAMVRADDPALPRKVLSFITDRTSPTTDFHYLTVLSRLTAPTPANDTAKIANALLSLDRKLAGQEQRPKQNWSVRLAEVARRLAQRDSTMPEALLRHPQFARPAHLNLVGVLGSERYLRAARLFVAAVKKDPKFPWTGPLIDLLSALPDAEVRPLFRAQWANAALRDELLPRLAKSPELADRDKFVEGLSSARLEVAQAAMSALLQLPRDDTGRGLVPAVQLLRRLVTQPNEQGTRAQVTALLAHLGGEPLRVQEQSTEPSQLQRAYEPVFDWFARKYPLLAGQLEGAPEETGKWSALLKTAPWEKGDPARGELHFDQRGCRTCHATTTPLGPDLSGVAARLSPLDLMNAILFPSRDVAAPYRMTTFRMRDGQSHTGMVAFESADGVIVRTSLTGVVRLDEAEIASRQPSDLSLMPSGLLDGLGAQDLADLYAYLRTLAPKR